jgi:hypothetical protein
MECNIITVNFPAKEMYEKIFSIFIDKFMPQALADLNNTYRPDKHILLGGKAINHYFNLFHNNSEIKSCDYDVNILNDNSNNTPMRLIQRLDTISTKCNMMFNSDYKFNIFLYNNIIKEFNSTNPYFDFELLEIGNADTIPESNNMQVFTYLSNPEVPKFSRNVYSVYIKIFYRIKSFAFINEINHAADMFIGTNLPDHYKKKLGLVSENSNLDKQTIYYSGITICDLHWNSEFNVIINRPEDRIPINIRYGIQLTNDNINEFKIREWSQTRYNRTVSTVKLYVPDIDIILVNLFFYSYLKSYIKRRKNKLKLRTIIELLENPLDNINFILYTNTHKTFENFSKVRLQTYNAIFNFYMRNNLLECTINDYNNFINLLLRILNKFSLSNSNNLIRSLCLLQNKPDCPNEVSDNILSVLIRHYNDVQADNFWTQDYQNTIAYYIQDSSRINIPLITRTVLNMQLQRKIANIINYMAVNQMPNNNLDFFVYSVSQIFTIDNDGKAYFNIDDIYTFPSFKSSTFRLCSPNHAAFIGYDINSFVMRILIKSSINNGEYCFIGMQNSQYEVLLAYGTQIKITGISRCYINLFDRISNIDMYQNCWLIDCELLPKIVRVPANILPNPIMPQIPLNIFGSVVQNGGKAEELDIPNYSQIIAPKVRNPDKSDMFKEKIRNPKPFIDILEDDKFIEYQNLVNEHIKHNKFIIL